MNYLDSLPIELLSAILIQLSILDLSRLAQVSSSLSVLCRSWDLWADKTQRDFNFPRKLFFRTHLDDPRLQYWQLRHYHQDIKKALPLVAYDNNVDLMEYFIHHGDMDLGFAVAMAARYHRLEMIDYLLSQGSDINKALIGAAVGGQPDLIPKFITAGATDIELALTLAASYDQVEMIPCLMTHGATGVNAALRGAAKNNQVRSLKYLMNHGATDLSGALIGATENGSFTVVEYLVTQTNVEPYVAVMTAIRHNHLPILKCLCDHGAEQSYDMNHALHWAYIGGNLEIIKYLESLVERNNPISG
jgi:ankyrin repeat protein